MVEVTCQPYTLTPWCADDNACAVDARLDATAVSAQELLAVGALVGHLHTTQKYKNYLSLQLIDKE